MMRSGGSATLYGVLYQLIGSIHYASLYFAGTKKSDELVAARLIFEPADGGDIQIATAGERLVQQWKSRRTKRLWTIREIIEKVLPDLVRSVQPNSNSRYQFITEGRCSDWSKAKGLFQWMRQQGCPDDPFAAIDACELPPQRFYGTKGALLPPRAFFGEILSTVRLQTDSKDLCPRRLWCLLANFEIESQVLAIELRAKVDEFIASRTSMPDEIEAMRGRLCQLVLQLATEQGKVLTPSEFFGMADLANVSLKEWRKVFGTINGIAAERLRDWFHFDADLNVRGRPEWPDSLPVLLITGRVEDGSPGESGQGKTFTLGAIGYSDISRSRIVVVVRPGDTSRNLLQDVADLIWKAGFQRRSNIRRLYPGRVPRVQLRKARRRESQVTGGFPKFGGDSRAYPYRVLPPTHADLRSQTNRDCFQLART